MLMGLRDATMKSRQLDQLTEANIEAMELPFEVNEWLTVVSWLANNYKIKIIKN